MSDLLAAARQYSQGRKWSVLPVKGKAPAVRTWKQFQSVRVDDEAGLSKWFTRADVTGLALVFGPASGDVVCRDFDDLAGYEQWAAEHPDLAAALPTVATGRGRHVYFACAGARLTKFADGELRAFGGIVVLPPSIHPNGTPYRWIIPLPDGDLPTIDPEAAGLLGRATEKTERTEKTENTQRTEQSEKSEHLQASVVGGDGEELESMVAHAVRTTTPTGYGQRNRCIFNFARALKAIPALRDAEPRTLKKYVRRWFEAARPCIVTKDFLVTYADFVTAWERVRFALGDGPMDDVLERAEATDPPACAAEYEEPKAKLLVSVCRELQRGSGDCPFFLSVRKAGELVGIDPTTASRWFKAFVADRVLRLEEKGAKGGGKASRFRYIGD